MTAAAFDTLKFAQTLRDKVKFTTEQAEAISEAFAMATSEDMVTKAYLDLRIEAAKSEIIKWLFGTNVAQTGLIIAAVKLLH